MSSLPAWSLELLLIIVLLVVVAVVVGRLPRIELGHSAAFLRRRVANWLPLGLTYAFFYMGRYNIDAAKNAGLMTKEELGIVTFWGALTYGFSFLLNGPLTDRFGGRKTILIGCIGSAAANVLMGLYAMGSGGLALNATLVFSVIYSINMYFQSFGAVSIVKVNASWFHIRERGVFGGIFGILISLGVYFAYDWSRIITDSDVLPNAWVFFIPAILLVGFFLIDLFLVFDTPGQAGFKDFDPGDASSGDDGPKLPVLHIMKRMITNPIIVTIAIIECCSGFVRGSIMKWTYIFLPEIGAKDPSQPALNFAYEHWGMMLCLAGILGGVFAGTISDRLFDSRRGPSAGILYVMVTVGIAIAAALITMPAVGYVLVMVVMAVIGVHGMLSGTASMDFGGKKNAGIAVGFIDGMVYLGFAIQANIIGHISPTGAAKSDPGNWRVWLFVTLPAAVLGLVLSLKIWNAKPKPKGGQPS
ncbi:MAG TPA: MFS transporter [Kofleriaceae bacterium]|nr:MFS transporter [Kofleriaceae bacterium]